MSGRILTTELNKLIYFFAEMAVVLIKAEIARKRLVINSIKSPETPLKVFAMDCIADLFQRDPYGQYPAITGFLYEKLDQRPDSDLLVHVRHLVFAHVQQYLSHQFRLNDREGWNINRNVALAPRRNPRICVFRHNHRDYFYCKVNKRGGKVPDCLNNQRPSMPMDALIQLIEATTSKSETFPTMIEKVLIELMNLDNYRWYLERSEFQYAFRRIHRSFGKLDPHMHSQAELAADVESSPITDRSEDIIRCVTEWGMKFIKESYQLKGKITNDYAHLYSRILTTFFEDAIRDGNSAKLPWYLQQEGFQTSDVEYQLHVNRLEYLIKRLRREIRKRFKDSFPGMP